MSAIFDGLNDEQKNAVACVDGPVLIVAGAGSGKTRVLTSRVANILGKGVPPESVMALTFTKKAASEMKERIAAMVGAGRARKVVMGTFHAIIVRFLREWSDYLGYPSQFTIYDTSDSQSAIKTCVKELGLDEKAYKPRDVLARISSAKNNLVSPAAYRMNQNAIINDTHAKRPKTVDIYERYQAKLKQAGVMDFDDILVNMHGLLKSNPEARRTLSSRFSHIMVDEYQDTNKVQYEILKLMVGTSRNICVVGDDSQSIYAFRGARVQNILSFKNDFPGCNIFRLERNYRSTQMIVNAANSLIARNEARIPKQCYSVGEEGDPIAVERTYSEKEEAAAVVSGILSRIRTDHATYQDFAILYRTNAQSRSLEESLRSRNIPYMIYSGNSFFERAEVKDMMAYFKLAVNPSDDESFKRVVNKPARGIGDTSIAALYNAAHAHGCSLFKAAFAPDLEEVYGLRAAAVAKIREFCSMMDGFAARVSSTDAYVLAVDISEKSGMYAFYKSDTSVEGQARTANVEELLNSVASYIEDQKEEEQEGIVTLGDYLENVSLLSNADTDDGEDASNRVALMTVHSSKGLEFPYVFIVGLEENLFPSGGLGISPSDLEEERRLFYVALTRAKRNVTLTYALSRIRNGNHEQNPPSRFIREIDARYLDSDVETADFDPVPSFGRSQFFTGAGKKTAAMGSSYSYGGSSKVTYSRNSQASGRTGQGAASGNNFGLRPHPTACGSPVHEATGGHGCSAGSTLPGSRLSVVPNVPKPAEIDPDFVPVPMTELYVGERVEHNRFGGGQILEITGRAPEMKARIKFDDWGEKLLLLKYAKLRPERP